MRLQKGTVDGYEWRCRNQSKDNRHDVVRSVRKGTWFSESKLAITIIFRLTRYWFGKSLNAFLVNDLKVNKNMTKLRHVWRRSNDHKLVNENFHKFLASIARVYPPTDHDEMQALSKNELIKQYKDVFTGVGEFPNEPYHITLKDNAVPGIHPPRRVSLALQPKLKRCDEDSHDAIMSRVLERAKLLNIKFNPGKLQYRVSEVKYVGQIISKSGIKPDPDHIRAIVEMPTPKSKTEVRRLLGMMNYPSKFIPNVSKVTAPLREIIHENVEFNWGKE
ncbi:retrovirus-related Pol polyprotein from transposon 17.6 [Trichonephila clavipes]|nr:retrovirus-related Pol polyprotein from transposon 17.6 [Trichonephila clavipes]